MKGQFLCSSPQRSLCSMSGLLPYLGEILTADFQGCVSANPSRQQRTVHHIWHESGADLARIWHKRARCVPESALFWGGFSVRIQFNKAAQRAASARCSVVGRDERCLDSSIAGSAPNVPPAVAPRETNTNMLPLHSTLHIHAIKPTVEGGEEKEKQSC